MRPCNARLPFHGARSVAALLLISSSATLSGAAEITVQNDSIPPGTPLTAFLSGERAAAWLTMPVAGDIVGVEVIWSSMFGGTPPSLETAITLSPAGTYPTPGAVPLATIVLPTLLDGVPNVFRHLDPPADTMPLQIPVTAGQVIVVDLEFLNTNANNNFAPSVEFDSDGCQNGLNSVFALPGGWLIRVCWVSPVISAFARSSGRFRNQAAAGCWLSVSRHW